MATDQDLNLLIKADASGVKAGMAEGAQAVTAGSEQMKQSTEKLAQASKGAIQQMIEQWKSLGVQHAQSVKAMAADSSEATGKMASSFESAVGGIKGSMGGLGDALGFVQKHFVALAAIAAGTGVFKEGISETTKFTGQALGLSKALGIGATEAGILNMALGDVYVTTEEYTEISRGLTRQMKMNEESINKMGVETRDSSGHFRNQNDIIKDAGKVLEGYKEGTDRNLAAQVIFGRGVQDAGKVIKAAGADIDGAREKSESLGLMLSVDNVKDMKAYKAAMNDVDDAIMAVKKAIGDQVMPIFAELGNWMASIGPAAVTITKGAFGGLAATFWYVRNGVVVLWETINAMVISVAEPIRAVSAAVAKAMTGDFAGAKSELTGIADNIKNAWGTAMDEMAKSSEKTNEKVKNLFVQGEVVDAKKSGQKDFVNPKEKPEKEDKPKLMRGFEAELSEMKVAYQEAQREQGSFQEFSKQQELTFWQQKLSAVKSGSEDEKAVRLKTNQLKLAIDKNSFEVELAGMRNQMGEFKNNTDAKLAIAEEYAAKVKKGYGEESTQYKAAQKEIQDIHRQAKNQMAQADQIYRELEMSKQADLISQARDQSQLQTQLGLQTKEQELAQEQQFEDQLYQLKFNSLQAKLALAAEDPDKNPVELAKIHGQIEELTLQHNQRLRQIDGQMQVEGKKDWKSMFSTIESGMANVIKGVMMGTMTMGQAIRSLMSTVLNAVVGMIAQMIAKWIAAKLIEMIWSKTAAVANVSANAGVAASAAMASVAAIPYVGWAMAPEVGAATYGLAMSYSMFSARNGFDIPAGVNPMVQLHEKEMVLPAKQADAVRDLADGNGGSSRGDVNVNIQGQQMKGGFFMVHRDELVRALKSARRDFAI